MNEKLLQYLWNYKLFKNFNFVDVEGVPIEILDFGIWNFNAGPDFSLAKIKIQNLMLVGNIELHVKASDWNAHQHQSDRNFDNIILHVVYENDEEIKMLKNNNIPTLELKNYIDPNIVSKYQQLFEVKKFIPCEDIFSKKNIPFYFEEENLLKKLNEKSINIESSLSLYKNDFEAVLFHYLAYNFGLKINAEIFFELAQSLDFKIISKIRHKKTQLEALLFGICGWLENPADETMKKWKIEYDFIQSKFNLRNLVFAPKFLRLRPQNFPTLRLSQLADLYHQHQNVFSKLIHSATLNGMYNILENVQASEYWNSHYNFGAISTKIYVKKLSPDFIYSIIINTVLPFKYYYHQYLKENINDEIIDMYQQIKSEKNTIISQWKNLGVPIRNSLQSQAFLYQYKHLCAQKKCLNCGIGLKILKNG